MDARPDEPMTIPDDDQRAIDMVFAIREGDLGKVRRLLAAHPGLERAHVAGRKGGWRTPLHMVTDWPGYFPNGPEIVRLLANAGADPNDRGDGPKDEAPLHWAASSDDYEVAVALIEAGADVNMQGGSIGAPLANAIGYGCWHVARLLLARGAHVEHLWQAAALGDWIRLEELLGADPAPSADDVSHAFWQACSGGQLRVAHYLVAHGADPGYSPDYAHGQTAAEVAAATDTRHQALVTWLESLNT